MNRWGFPWVSGEIPMPSARKPEPASSFSSPELGRIVEILTQGKENGASGITQEQSEVIYALGRRLFSAGEFSDAITVFTSLCLHDHGNRHFWMGLGGSLQGAGKLEKAIDAYGMAGLCGSLDDPEPFYHIALCHLKLERFEAARQLLESIAQMGETGNATHRAFRSKARHLKESFALGADETAPAL
jgi:type III secretion system low calcium response chaperone LcrH/SycD